MPDFKWLLDVFKLPLRATIATALASAAMLGLTFWGLLDLGPISIAALPILIVVCVVSSILAMVGIVHALTAPLRENWRQSALQTRRAVRRKEEEEQRAGRQRATIARLDHLSQEEVEYVADCLRRRSPTFYTYVHHGPVTMLVAKGLVWTPGGQHHQDHYPFSFYDFTWAALLERRDEFIAKDDERRRAEEASRMAQLRRR